MASNMPKTISLKLLVDKEKHRVIFAEADSDFVDVLFSFLTLPVGTVIKLLSKQSQQFELGCMHNLYRSVENLEDRYFSDGKCKTMLLHTRNSSADMCRKLRVNIDDTEPMKYYICSEFSRSHVFGGLLSTFGDGRCGCGGKLTMEIPFHQSDQENGVFVKTVYSFMITDDLQVMPMSAETTLGLLHNYGARAEALEEKCVDVTHEKVSCLLKHMLFSKASLTEIFLLEHREVLSKPNFEEACNFYSGKQEDIGDVRKFDLNVVVQKSNHRIICAEAGDDFVSFLMSMLTFPLGTVVKLFDGAPSLGSISTLYKSVQGLSTEKHMISPYHKEMLLSPMPALQYACKYQVLDIVEATPPSYFYNYYYYSSPSASLTTTGLYSNSSQSGSLSFSKQMSLFKIEGFVKESANFIVADDLVVTPFSCLSMVAMLKQLKLSIDDIEKQVISIGRFEALQLLGSSMTSKTVLTTAFRNIIPKNIKQESC